MSDVMEYKCPYCGGKMVFDSGLQKMKCPYCDAQLEVDQFKEPDAQEGAGASAQGEADVFENACGGEWQAAELGAMKVYGCQSCGGEIIAEETTGASSCPYCGNVVVMKGQFSGGLKPDLIIPFMKNKQMAKEAYQSHLKGRPFLPKIFKRENHIDEIKGMYVPFWIFDADVEMNCTFDAQRISEWTSGSKHYTETKYYNVERGGTVSFTGIPTDASKKMEDTLMESIEPYDVGAAVPFKAAYLSGYLADRYDDEASDRFERARQRIRSSASAACRSTVTGYSSVSRRSEEVTVKHSSYRYALYPVWILNTTWHGKKFTFAMNGQTGKMTGDLPMDKGAFVRYILTRGALVGGILYALKWAFMLAV